MIDPANKIAEATLARIERRIRVEYAQAQREIQTKLDDYMKAFRAEDREWQDKVADGRASQEAYEAWKRRELIEGQRWEALRDAISQDLLNASKIAKSIAEGYMPEVYAENHSYGTYELEIGSGMDTSYSLYSREAVERIFRDDPQILMPPGKKASKDIAEGRAKRWNNRIIQSVALQAILQGETITDIATRLSNAVCDHNRKASVRNARTMMTGVQNAGRMDAYRRGRDMGIESEKQWIATLDMRTRHKHRQLDMVTVPLDEPFKVDRETIMFPGDRSASPSMVYNCRCTMVAKVKGWTSMSEGRRSLKKLKDTNLTYDEWKASHVEKHRDILHQDKTFGKSRRKDWNVDYKGV